MISQIATRYQVSFGSKKCLTTLFFLLLLPSFSSGVQTQKITFRAPSTAELSKLAHDAEMGITCNTNRVCHIERQIFQNYYQGSNELAQYVRLAPFFSQGKLQGLRLYSTLPPELLRKLLLQSGDIFQSINGFDLTSPLSALGGMVFLQFASQFRVTILRKEKPIVITYQVVTQNAHPQQPPTH